MIPIVRDATRLDIPRLVSLGEEFALLSQPIHRFNISRFKIIEFTNQVVENPGCVVKVLEVNGIVEGFICGMVNRIYFSEDVALQELAWYVKRNSKGGILLLLAFEKAAIDLGVNRIIVGNKPAYCDLGEMYKRRGYTLLEHQYVKHIGV